MSQKDIQNFIMYKKDTKNSKRLRNVAIMFLIILTAIFIFGILTRYPSTIDQLSETEQTLNEIKDSLIDIQTQLDEIKTIQSSQSSTLSRIEEKLIEEEAVPTPNPLSGPALYASYADEIVTNIYPDIQSDYVKAIIWHESRYNPDSINSRTGVTGLMQISPKWHTKRAESLGVTDLTDPYGNILVGCDILNELTQKHDFNYALNFFAGGYPYADRYKNSVSPFVEQLNDIIHQMENGEIVLEGTTSVS